VRNFSWVFVTQFDEDNTFLISDWFKHVPNDVLAKIRGAGLGFWPYA